MDSGFKVYFCFTRFVFLESTQMPRHPTGSSLPLLLLGALLAACGAPVLEYQEPLGIIESALCSGSSVSTLTLSGISTYRQEMAGSGSWGSTSPANGVRLEYFIDNVKQAIDDRVGSSGSWSFSQAGVSCGTHTFQVNAYPLVIDSAGNRTVCLNSGPRSLSQSVSEPCPPPLGCNGDGVCNLYCSLDKDCFACPSGIHCTNSDQCGRGGVCERIHCRCDEVLIPSTTR